MLQPDGSHFFRAAGGEASTPTAEKIAGLVVERLIQDGGLENLANANLMKIEHGPSSRSIGSRDW